MRYFKIYKQCVRVHKAYWELIEDEFNVEVGDYVAMNVEDFENEDGSINYQATEEAMDELTDQIVKEAKSDDGFDYGEYNLYIRDDDADKYDIQRQTR